LPAQDELSYRPQYRRDYEDRGPQLRLDLAPAILSIRGTSSAGEEDKHLFIQKDFAAHGNRAVAAGLSLGE
jgi:hypothetical protein